MTTYKAWIEKSLKCLCYKFQPGGLFSPNKFAEKCGENFNTAKKHLNELINTIACGKKLVSVGPSQYTLVVPDDPFESPESSKECGRISDYWWWLSALFGLKFVSGFVEGIFAPPENKNPQVWRPAELVA